VMTTADDPIPARTLATSVASACVLTTRIRW